MGDHVSKQIIEKEYSYELALSALTIHDIDWARFYVEKDSEFLLQNWKNLTHFSNHAQHHIISKIIKNYEMKEFI